MGNIFIGIILVGEIMGEGVGDSDEKRTGDATGAKTGTSAWASEDKGINISSCIVVEAFTPLENDARILSSSRGVKVGVVEGVGIKDKV